MPSTPRAGFALSTQESHGEGIRNTSPRMHGSFATFEAIPTECPECICPEPIPEPLSSPITHLIVDDGTDFGVDIECFDDPYPNLTLVNGRRNYLLAMARRFITETGFLRDVVGDEAPGAAEYGLDLRGMLNIRQGSKRIAGLASLIEDQCRLDERTLDCTAEVSLDRTTSTLDVDIHLETAAGPFELVLKVSALTVAVLDGSGNLLAGAAD